MAIGDAPRDARRFAPATERNRSAILEVLRGALPAEGCVLEIASGSGEHAVWFGHHLPHLVFQPSDPDPVNRASIAAWIAHTAVANVLPPIALDATGTDWSLPQSPAAVLCINMIHIAPWTATLGLLRGASATLPPGGLLYLYGPFRRDGAHTSESNAMFDADLRSRDATWGVRDLEAVSDAAHAAGFGEPTTIAMPANNLSVVFRRM
jgi:hypothetical protein